MSVILEATIRVLDEVGLDRLTTTRVAAVAGVSVGTLYQYFPNRDALLDALLADHLERAIGTLEREAQACTSEPLENAVERIVRAFLAVKASRALETQIIHKAFGIGMRDERPLVKLAMKRAYLAVANVLARHEPFESALVRSQLACDAVEGMVRGQLDDASKLGEPAWIDRAVRVTIAALR